MALHGVLWLERPFDPATFDVSTLEEGAPLPFGLFSALVQVRGDALGAGWFLIQESPDPSGAEFYQCLWQPMAPLDHLVRKPRPDEHALALPDVARRLLREHGEDTSIREELGNLLALIPGAEERFDGDGWRDRARGLRETMAWDLLKNHELVGMSEDALVDAHYKARVW